MSKRKKKERVRNRELRGLCIAWMWRKKKRRAQVQATKPTCSLTCPRHWHMMPRSRTSSFFSIPDHMLQLTETTLFHWDSTHSLALGLEFASSYNAKKNFSGPNTRNVQMWVSNLQSTGSPLQVGGGQVGGVPAGSQSYPTTIANTESSASLGTQPVSPMRSSNDGLGYRGVDVEESEASVYRNALGNLPKRSQRASSGVRVTFNSIWC